VSTKNKSLNILWLWPDILSLHGDRGNVMALERICGLYGIEPNITRVTRLTDRFDPDTADIILLGPGELSVLPRITEALSAYAAELKSYANSGGVIFATGTTGAALGVSMARLDGSGVSGLGLLDMTCRERKTVLGDDVVYRTQNDLTICGIQIQMIDVSLAKGQEPFGKTVYGYGNNGTGTEGAIRNNVVFTNAMGPVLVRNPWLAVDLISRALSPPSLLEAESAETIRFDPALFGLELASAEAIIQFNEKKEKKK